MGIGTALVQREAADDAVDAQVRSSREATDAYKEASSRALDMQRPFFEAGYAGTAALMDMLGLPRTGLGATARANESRRRGVTVGDTSLPEGTTTRHIKDGWYDVEYDGQRIGTLRPGGKSGRFINDSGFDVEAAFRGPATAEGESNPADLSSYGKYDWKTDPGYQFRMDEGMRAIERSAASRGQLNSGANLRAITRYAQGTASEEFSRVFDRIGRIAGFGGSAATAGSNIVVGTGDRVGAALTNSGDARASGYIAQGNAFANASQNTGRALGYFFGGG
jgi:hypothetical protein